MSGTAKMGFGSPTGIGMSSWVKTYFKYWAEQWIERLQGPSELRACDSKTLEEKKKREGGSVN